MSYHSRQPLIASISLTSLHNHPQKIGPWKLGKTLGRGATGRVLLATHISTGQKAAVKVVSKSELQDGEQPKDDNSLPYGIEREIIIMKLLTHPNVLRLYDVWETSKALYLVLEYVEGGELFDLLVERGPLQEHEAIKYFRQIILGTAYCHALGICHRDLKPENLLLDGNLNVKLADFGMAALELNGKLLETSCGSPHYAAPEIVSGLKYHGAASDIWSCGVILFALLTGRLPFDDENIRNLLLKVQAGSFEMPDDISYEAQDLIDKMLTADPLKRINTEKILNHPLLNKYPIPNEDLISVKSLPHPETAYKSLGSLKNIDQQILANLSILWHDRPQDEIINNLLKPGSTPEKTFYALLMRYRHNHDDSFDPSPKKLKSIPASNSFSSKNTPKKRRSVSRPTSFQYNNYNNSSSSYPKNKGRLSNSSSFQNSPNKRFSYSISPVKSPYRSPRKSPRRTSPRKFDDDENPPAIPRNIYNEIVEAQRNGSNYSMPPSLPSKDSHLKNVRLIPELERQKQQLVQQKQQLQQQTDQFQFQPSQPQPYERIQQAPQAPQAPQPTKPQPYQVQREQQAIGKENPIVDEVSSQDLMASASISPAKTGKRGSVMKKSNSKNRLSRKSLRSSMTTGLKRNSITMKLLSTYAKLSGETDWEYMDKSTKRTSASFATLCDKIFSQEQYDEEDERLIDEEELRAREYERLMEIERKKHEAELLARKELEKRRRRQKRKSLLSSKKLSIMVKEDNSANNSEVDITTEQIDQPKRQSKLRALSEGNNDNFTSEEVENLKLRSVTAPHATRRQTPVLTRRPISRLDPLWTAHENEEINRAKEALDAEYGKEIPQSEKQSSKNRESRVSKRDSRPAHRDQKVDGRESYYSESKNRNRESFVTDGYSLRRRMSKDSYYAKDADYELPEPEVADDSELSEEYMSEIRKSRLLNSQLNVKGDKYGKDEPKTLIASVNIPKVTRKSRHFSNSNKRLSVLSMYSTKESYQDLSTILSNTDDNKQSEPTKTLKMKTSFAERLERTGLPTVEDEEDEQFEEGSVLDFDEHVSNRRNSQFGKQYGDKRPVSQLPDLPNDGYDGDDTFATRNDAAHRNKYSNRVSYDDESDGGDANVFDSIKLPDGKSTKSTMTPGTSKSTHKSMLPNAESLLMPDMKNVQANRNGKSQTYPKVRKQPNSNSNAKQQNGKTPLVDATNIPEIPIQEKRSKSIFRKLSWGSKKALDEPVAPPSNGQLRTPAGSRDGSGEQKKRFFSWFSSAEKVQDEIKRFNTILPKHEMSTALFALLNSWQNFGLKDLRNDQVGYYITGAISGHNAFNLKSCKFRIKINARENNQKSEIVCARVKGSAATTNTLFKEIEKVLNKEGVMDK